MKKPILSFAALSALFAAASLNAELLDLTASGSADFPEKSWDYFESETDENVRVWEIDLGREYSLFGVSKDVLFLPLPIGSEYASLRLSIYDAGLFPVYDEPVAADSSGLTILFPEGTFGRWIRFSFYGDSENLGSRINELKVFTDTTESVSQVSDEALGMNRQASADALAVENDADGGIVFPEALLSDEPIAEAIPEEGASLSATPMLLQATADESMTIEYEYNARGELTKVRSGVNVRAIEYDQRGNITKM